MPETLPLRILPFADDSFDWNRFESFCLAVVRALPDVRRADRYGVMGEPQKGIDIEADLVDGRKRTVQCRLRKRITLPQAQSTVEQTTYDADEHEIWITCAVGTKVSDYVDRLSDWLIESDEGISQKLRGEVPREKARLIVRDAFGAQVARDFLGPGGPVGFVSTNDFYAPLDEPSRLLRQDLDLVGRGSELNAIVAAASDPLVRVVVLPGRGGIGKTRLLRAAAERLATSGKRVLFASDPSLLTAHVLDDLPLEDTVVVVDDAHRHEVHLAGLMAASLRRSDPLALVLAVRPAGLEGIAMAAGQAQLEPQNIVVMPTLKPLSSEETRALAELALDGRDARGERLAGAANGLPLLAVLGGRMIARGDFDGDPATGGRELRRAVMTRFVAEQRGRVTPRIPEDKAKALLELLAALNPLDTADAALMGLVASELGVAVSQIRRWLGDVQEAGLLQSRGDLRRLTPDILADELLYEACLDRQGRPTGRATELWQRYAEHAQTELLANLGELDWRTPDEGVALLDEVWEKLLAAFEQSSAWGREELISKIEGAAYFWPRQVLRLVDVALVTPAEITDLGVGIHIDDSSVREKLPRLLRAVGQHPGYVREAMDRLWLLARDDERQTNPHPDHPLRVLGELGGFDHGPAHHDALLDLVEAELAKPGVEEHPNSPLLLVDSLLTREGSRSRAEGLTWTMTPYFVDPVYAVRWRERIRTLLVKQAIDGHPRDATTAAKRFGEALQLPFGVLGARVPDELREAWKPDQEATLEAIADIAQRSDDTAVRVAIRRALEWHAEHGPWSDLNERAAQLIRRPSGDDDEILAAIASPWDTLDEERRIARDKRVAETLLSRCPTGAELADHLDELTGQIISRGMADFPETGNILHHVFVSSLQHAEEIWDWAVDHPTSRMVMAGSLAISELRRAGRDVDDRLSAAGGSKEPTLRLLAASYLCSGAWFGSPSQVELDLLGAMADDPDPGVRQTISTTVLRLRSPHPDVAVSVALRARIEPDDRSGADFLFSTISDYGVSRLPAEDTDRMTEQLILVSEPEYFAHKLLNELGEVDPERVIDIWSRRLRREADEDPPGYRPVPFHDYGTEMLGAAAGAQRVALHATLLRALEALGAWGRRQLGQIYWRLAAPGIPGDTDATELIEQRAEQIDAALAAISNHLAAEPQSAKAIGDLLSELPWQILLARPTWVNALLTEHDGTETHLSSGMHAAAVGGMHGRTVGEDSPRWTATLAGAQAAGQQLTAGSTGAVFFDDLAGYAQREIEKDRREDDQERNGWQ